MKRTDARSLTAEAQFEKRQLAVKAVLDDGMQQHVAAEMVGVTRQAVGKWIKLYRSGGWDALKPQKQGRPKKKQLKPYQIANLCNTIKDKEPEQLRLFGCLWTAEAVAKLIERRFKISYSTRHVQRLLKEWGYTPQKPLRRAYEQNPKVVQEWLETEYPAIKRQAKREKATIYWEDETGARSDYQAGRSYAPVGKTPIVRDTGKRFGCNVVSALTNQGGLCFKVFSGRFNAAMFIEFLGRLVKHSKRKVFVITDGHPTHKAKKVKAWLERNEKKIRLFYLPPYSPELNPDEYLNNDIKQNAVGRRRAADQKELMENVRSHLRSRQKTPEIVANFFHHPDVQYAAEE